MDDRSPNAHHYEFSHTVIPFHAFNNTRRMQSNFDGDADRSLASFWSHTRKHLEDDVPCIDEKPSIAKVSVNSEEAWLITMPRPRVCPESFFVCFLFGEVEVYSLDMGLQPPVLFRRMSRDGSSTVKGFFSDPTHEHFLRVISANRLEA